MTSKRQYNLFPLKMRRLWGEVSRSPVNTWRLKDSLIYPGTHSHVYGELLVPDVFLCRAVIGNVVYILDVHLCLIRRCDEWARDDKIISNFWAEHFNSLQTANNYLWSLPFSSFNVPKVTAVISIFSSLGIWHYGLICAGWHWFYFYWIKQIREDPWKSIFIHWFYEYETESISPTNLIISIL